MTDTQPKTESKTKKRLPWWKRLLFIVVINVAVLGVLAIIAEIGLRLAAPASDYEVIADEDMTLSMFSDDPYLGWELRPNYGDQNSLGFRGPERTVEKPAGVRRIAIVGDSVTYGLGLPYEQSYPAVMEKKLNASGSGPVEVLNFGVPGYSTFQYYKLLEKRVFDFDPDLVILTFTAEDIETSPVVIKVDGQMCLFRNQLEGTSAFNNRLHWWLFRHSYLYRFLYKSAVVAFATGEADFNDVYVQPEVQWENVRRIARLCEEHGVDFMLVLSPYLYPHYVPPADVPIEELEAPEMILSKETMAFYRKSFDKIRELAKEDGFETVDLGPMFKQEGAIMKLMPHDHEHLSKTGCRMVGEELAKKVQEIQ